MLKLNQALSGHLFRTCHSMTVRFISFKVLHTSTNNTAHPHVLLILFPEGGHHTDASLYTAPKIRSQLVYPPGMCCVLPVLLKDELTYHLLEYLPYADRPYSQTLFKADQTAYAYGPLCRPKWVGVGRSPSQGSCGFLQVPSELTLMKGPVLPRFFINASRS